MDEDYSPKYEIVFDEKLNAVRVKVEDSFVTLIHSCMVLKTDQEIQEFQEELEVAWFEFRRAQDRTRASDARFGTGLRFEVAP